MRGSHLNSLIIGKAKTGTTLLASMVKNATALPTPADHVAISATKPQVRAVARPFLKLHNYVDSGRWEIKSAEVEADAIPKHEPEVLCMEPKGIADILKARPRNAPFTTKIIFEHYAGKLRQIDALIHNELDIEFNKLVFIQRDIRDEMVSRLIYLSKAMITNGLPPEVSKKWIDIIEIKERDPSSLSFFDVAEKFNEIFNANAWQDIVLRHSNTALLFDNFITQRVQRDHITVQYEDIIDGSLDTLSNYFGLTFDNDVAGVDLGNFAYTKRTASYGRWREFFLPSDVDRIRPILQAKGLDRYDNWDLTPVSALNPSEFSLYIKRLCNLDDT